MPRSHEEKGLLFPAIRPRGWCKNGQDFPVDFSEPRIPLAAYDELGVPTMGQELDRGRLAAARDREIETRSAQAKVADLHSVEPRRQDRLEPKGPGSRRHQLRLGAGIAAREKGDLMSPRHQLFGEIADDALRTSVERRRHALAERRHLGDPETAAHDAVESEDSGASSARVRITGVSIGQSSSASGGMLTRRASTGPVTSVKPSETTRSPTLLRATAGGFSCTTRSTHHFSCSSAYLIAQRPMRRIPGSPVVRVAVVIVEPRLVLPGYLAVGLVRRGFLDPLLREVDHERLLARGDAAQPCRGEEHFATRKPVPRLHHHVAGLEVRVAEQDVAHLADLAVGGEDGVVEHVLNAPQHESVSFWIANVATETKVARSMPGAHCQARIG